MDSFEVIFQIMLLRFKVFAFSGLDKLRADADRVLSGKQSLLDAPDFSGAHILPCKYQKALDLKVFS